MELATVRTVADWLAGTTSPANSVNALLPSVPRDGTDTAPPLVTVYDATRHAWVARKTLPNDPSIDLPALAVFLTAPVTQDGEVMHSGSPQQYRDGQLQVAVAYLFQKSDTAVAMQNALYTKRAIVRSLKQLHDPAQESAARLRLSIHLYVAKQITLSPTIAEWERTGSSWLATAVLIDYRARDLAP